MRQFICLLAAALFSLAASAQPLYIAAAADLIYCLEELNTTFQKANPDAELKVSTGSSGNFYAQIQNGGPFDIFMSADLDYPRKLAAAGLADEKSLLKYAVGRIALWTVDPAIDIGKGLPVLRDAAVKRIALANPKHAPYGRAAKAALDKNGLWAEVQSKLVIGENIAQTAQFVQTGNASVGFVALSLLKSPKLANEGTYWVVPLAEHPIIEQGAIITSRAKDNELAKAYLSFLASPQARAIFDRYGFVLPAQ